MKPLYNTFERVDGDERNYSDGTMASDDHTFRTQEHMCECITSATPATGKQCINSCGKIYTCNYIYGSEHHELLEVDPCIYFTTTRQDILMISSTLDNVIKNTIVFNKTGLCK
jgi:hypothetical protein